MTYQNIKVIKEQIDKIKDTWKRGSQYQVIKTTGLTLIINHDTNEIIWDREDSVTEVSRAFLLTDCNDYSIVNDELIFKDDYSLETEFITLLKGFPEVRLHNIVTSEVTSKFFNKEREASLPSKNKTLQAWITVPLSSLNIFREIMDSQYKMEFGFKSNETYNLLQDLKKNQVYLKLTKNKLISNN